MPATFRFPNTLPVLVSLGLSSTLLSGCFLFTQRSQLITEAENFGKSLEAGSATLRDYFTALNDFDREGFKIVLSLNKDCRLGLNYTSKDCDYFADFLSGHDSLLGQPNTYISPLENSPYISHEALNARLQLLNLLSVYAKTLSALATDDSPSKFKESISELQAAGLSLYKRIQNAESNRGNSSDILVSSAESLDTKYLTPLRQIVSVLGTIYLNETKWSTISVSVDRAAPAVDTILGSLESDVEIAEEAYRGIAQNNARELLKYYNIHRGRITSGERRQLLDAYDHYNTMQMNLAQTEDKNGNLQSKSVKNLITPIRQAHSKLAILTSTKNLDLVAEIRALIATYDSELQEIKALIKTFNNTTAN